MASIFKTTGHVEPLNSELGWAGNLPPLPQDTERYRTMMILDLGDSLQIGDVIKAYGHVGVSNHNDTRPTAAYSNPSGTPNNGNLVFEYDKLPYTNGFLILHDEPVLDFTGMFTTPYGDVDTKILSPYAATNLPFVIHHGIIHVMGYRVVDDPADRYLHMVVTAGRNASMTHLIVDYESGQCKMDAEIVTGATTSAPAGNGSDLLPGEPDPGEVTFEKTGHFVSGTDDDAYAPSIDIGSDVGGAIIIDFSGHAVSTETAVDGTPTCDGVSMTHVNTAEQTGSGNSLISRWIVARSALPNPANTSATFAYGFTEDVRRTAAIVHTMVGAASLTPIYNEIDTSLPLSLPTDVPAGGGALQSVYGASSAGSPEWAFTGLVKTYDTNVETTASRFATAAKSFAEEQVDLNVAAELPATHTFGLTIVSAWEPA